VTVNGEDRLPRYVWSPRVTGCGFIHVKRGNASRACRHRPGFLRVDAHPLDVPFFSGLLFSALRKLSMKLICFSPGFVKNGFVETLGTLNPYYGMQSGDYWKLLLERYVFY
jgi:hypothetical protein